MIKTMYLSLIVGLIFSCSENQVPDVSFDDANKETNFNHYFRTATGFVKENPALHTASIVTEGDGKLALKLRPKGTQTLRKETPEMVCKEDTYEKAAACGKKYVIKGGSIRIRECAYCVYVD